MGTQLSVPPLPGCCGFKGKLRSGFGLGSGILQIGTWQSSFSESTNFDKPSWSSFAPLPLVASQASHIQDLMCLSSDTGRGMVRLHRKLRHDGGSTLDIASCSFLRIETTAVGTCRCTLIHQDGQCKQATCHQWFAWRLQERWGLAACNVPPITVL